MPKTKLDDLCRGSTDLAAVLPSLPCIGPSIETYDCMRAFTLVQHHLGLSPASPSTTPSSILFISIDLEFNWKRVTQLGISTFDSQTLMPAGLQYPVSNEYPILSKLYSTRVCKYQQRRRKPSHFGEQHLLTSERLQPLLREILTPIDEQGCPRKVVLVGHNIASDLTVIEKVCGLNISRDITSIEAILDTQHISQSIYRSKEKLSLKRLLIMLGLDYIGLHNAAHDSRYTLRALLFMFCHADYQECSSTARTSQDQEMRQRLTVVEEIAKFHRRRERRLWCENSPRFKCEGNTDMLDQEYGDSDYESSGLLAEIIEGKL